MKKLIRRLTRIELVLVYLVILAGSVVRMTGSGMGCPDWPKCFGHLIPPTERAQLEWHPNEAYKAGQIIIVKEALQVARKDFTTSTQFDPGNWEIYKKHNYAQFNPFHTWTEYINRLAGAISGIPMFLLVVVSLFYLRKDWRYFALSLAGLVLLGFEAWLGKLVVDGNLIPGSITIHMMAALLIVTLLIVLLGINLPFKEVRYTRNFRNLLLVALLLSLLQIIMGTQVREQIDHFKQDAIMRSEWIAHLDWKFYFHRSFSILIVVINAWLWYKNRQGGFGFKVMTPILGLVLLEILLGVILNYLGMPKFAQPLHLLVGTFLLGFQIYALVQLALAPVGRSMGIS